MPLTEDRPDNNPQRKAPIAVSQAPVLLRAEGLKKAFGGQVVLDDVNLILRQGEVVLLRGENGSGKTTLLNILTGNLEPDAGAIQYLADGTPRIYHFPRRWWQELNPFDHFTPEFVAREGVGRTWQDVRLFASQTLRDNIGVAEPGHPGENPALALFAPGTSARRETTIDRQADAMLARLGLAGREDSSADKISLGQTKRVAIGRAVAAGARILFLDEPLAGLDPRGIDDVLNLLKSLVTEHQVTLIIVEHIFNQPHLEDLVTTDWLLANGAIHRVDGNRKRNSAAHVLQTVSSSSLTQRPAWFALLAGADAEVVDEPLPHGALLTRIRRFGVFKDPPRPLIEIRDLIVKRGSRAVIGLDDNHRLAGLSLKLHAGEIAILHAPNGWGKSTLFAAVTGLIQTDSGSIHLEGRRVDGLPTWERVRQGLRALPAENQTFPNLKAEEVLRLARNPKAALGLGQLMTKICSSLSGGERQRVALAAITNGTICLYDEPFSSLDERNAETFIKSGCLHSFSSHLILTPSLH